MAYTVAVPSICGETSDLNGNEKRSIEISANSAFVRYDSVSRTQSQPSPIIIQIGLHIRCIFPRSVPRGAAMCSIKINFPPGFRTLLISASTDTGSVTEQRTSVLTIASALLSPRGIFSAVPV